MDVQTKQTEADTAADTIPVPGILTMYTIMMTRRISITTGKMTLKTMRMRKITGTVPGTEPGTAGSEE